MSIIFQTFVNGLITSSFYILLAVGLTLVLGVMNIANFAHGEFFMLGAYAVWLLYGGAIVLQRLRRWQGRHVAIASLTGLGAVLFSLFAVNIWSDFHTFL